MFTLDLNKFSLIMNEIYFTANTVHNDQLVYCANHDQNMIILIMIGLHVPHGVISNVKITAKSGKEASRKK